MRRVVGRIAASLVLACSLSAGFLVLDSLGVLTFPEASASSPASKAADVYKPSPQRLIGKAKARTIAFRHAGVTKKKVKKVSVKLGMRRSVKAYKVRFQLKQKRYTYYIGARKGKILAYNACRIKKPR